MCRKSVDVSQTKHALTRIIRVGPNEATFVQIFELFSNLFRNTFISDLAKSSSDFPNFRT